MKSSIYYFLLTVVLFFALNSCEEEEVSKKHVYTPEEIILRDSLEAAKQNVKANYIFKYDVVLPMDTINYSGIEVKIDTVILLEKLGLNTMSEVVSALGTVSAGVQTGHTITFFAISGSTRYDYNDKFTANGFGYWFDVNGDVCSWGNTDKLYSEMAPSTFTFFVGQHPKHIKKGDKYKIIQAIKKNDYRIAFIINVTVGDMVN